MTITKQRFNEIREELNQREITYKLFKPCHEALEAFHTGRTSFYNDFLSRLNDEQKEQFAVFAAAVTLDQLPIYSKDLAINDLIRELEDDGGKEKHPELTTLDLDRLIDDQINDGRLLRVYESNGAFSYVPDYLESLEEAISDFDPDKPMSSSEKDAVQPYLTALLGEDQFSDLSIGDQYRVAELFKEETIAYDKDYLKRHFNDSGEKLAGYMVWDREKVLANQNNFIKIQNDIPHSRHDTIYVHKKELEMVIRYGEKSLINKTEQFFPKPSQAEEIAKDLIAGLKPETVSKANKTALTMK